MDKAEDGVGHGDLSSHPRPQLHSHKSGRSSNEPRRDRAFGDATRKARATTPERTAGAALYISDSETLQMSPPTTTRRYRHRSISGRDASASVSNTDEEGPSETRRRRVQKKQRSKDDATSEGSPSSFIYKTRRRLGSLTTSTQLPETSSPTSSPTVPSPTGYPHLSDVRNLQSRGPRRAFSSDSTVPPQSHVAAAAGLNNDSDKILQLMRNTCGRMHGILFFRTTNTSVWESGYCAINVAPGSLVCQKHGGLAGAKTLLPDLRGCSVRTNYDTETQSTYISVTQPSSEHGVQLRPPVAETFDSWLAALLCWQPLRPKGVYNKLMQSQRVSMAEKRPTSARQLSDTGPPRSTAIVKVGRMLLWDGPLPAGSQRHLSRRTMDFEALGTAQPWHRVSCTLHDNGTFRLLAEADAQPICSIPLPGLARCAIQRMDESVLQVPFCLAVHTQYTTDASPSISAKPIILGLESKSALEAWFVLLRALTTPEFYGPDRLVPTIPGGVRELSKSEMWKSRFRIERDLIFRVTEAKLRRDTGSDYSLSRTDERSRPSPRHLDKIDVYVEIALGRDVRARTTVKSCLNSAFWAEEFSLQDLPSVLANISVAVKAGSPGEQEWTMVAPDSYEPSMTETDTFAALTGLDVASSDPDVGRVEIRVDELEEKQTIEKWWQLHDRHGHNVGQVLVKAELIETVVLVESEYEQISGLLHAFDTGLTTQMAQLLTQDLKKLSEVLLDLFQASGTVHDWLCTLIEEEIDGIYKDMPPVRMRFSGRIQSNDSYETAQQRELLVRDLSRSASQEANLLFRGNSLVSKALDAHMKRLGKEYLEETLGGCLRQISAKDPDCEVDPLKLKDQHHLERNWSNLVQLTTLVWKAISSSAAKCPPAMRMILKHIRSCAEDRYGSFIRTVKYTSVSGFLFLRFFCPAVLNPKLFGLVQENPSDRLRRTYVLVAKSLIVLANMTRFGNKETWMDPMNKFLVAATPEFKSFIDDICSISSSQPSTILDPQYHAAMQIRSRLSTRSKEGLPTLPFLLNAAQSMATLVDTWTARVSSEAVSHNADDVVRVFHDECLRLQQKTKQCIAIAEPAARPSTTLESQWQQLLGHPKSSPSLPQSQPVPSPLSSPSPPPPPPPSQQPRKTTNHTVPNITSYLYEDNPGGSATDQGITALPQRKDSRKFSARAHLPKNYEAVTLPSPVTTPPGDGRRLLYPGSRSGELAATVQSNNSSTLSLDPQDESRRQGSSREGSTKGRLFEYLNPARKKSRSAASGLDRAHSGQDDE